MVSKEEVSDFDSSCDIQSDSADKCQHSAADVQGTCSTALAVVPYDDTKIGHFHRTERKFVFEAEGKKHEIIIHQNWQELGVAAVVWDAVSFI